MSKFEVGQKVKSKVGGLIGTIDHQGEFGGKLYNFLELSDDSDGMPGFTDDELEPAPAPNTPPEPAQQDAGAGAGDAQPGDGLVDANTFQRAVRAMGTNDELAVALYQAHTFEGVANDMMLERDEAQASVARLETALAAALANANDARDTLRAFVATHNMWGNDKLKMDDMLQMALRTLQRISAQQATAAGDGGESGFEGVS